MKSFRSVNGHSHKPLIVAEELAPFIIQQCTVGLDTIVNLTPTGIFLLETYNLLIK